MKLKRAQSELMDLLPKKPEPKVYIQGHIPRKLFEEVSAAMKKDQITWAELLTAALTVYRIAHDKSKPTRKKTKS